MAKDLLKKYPKFKQKSLKIILYNKLKPNLVKKLSKHLQVLNNKINSYNLKSKKLKLRLQV